MVNNKESGDIGELEIIRLVKCPNCKNDLMKLPRNYPLVDVQCSGCTFRAQVKTVNSKPKAAPSRDICGMLVSCLLIISLIILIYK